MSGDSEVMNDCTPSVHMDLDDDLSSHSSLGYTLEDSSVSNRESTSDPPSASPSGDVQGRLSFLTTSLSMIF